MKIIHILGDWFNKDSLVPEHQRKKAIFLKIKKDKSIESRNDILNKEFECLS